MYIYTCIYLYIDLSIYIYTYIHIYINIYVYIYIHVHDTRHVQGRLPGQLGEGQPGAGQAPRDRDYSIMVVPRGLEHDVEFFCSQSRPGSLKYEQYIYIYICTYVCI